MTFTKITKIATFTAISLVALCLVGCGSGSGGSGGSGANDDTAEFQKKVWGNAGTDQSSGSAQSSSKQKAPDEKELNEIVKKQIWKDFVSDSPFEIVDVTANWVEKTAQSCSGDFSVNLRAKENLYDTIADKEGLEKLGIKNLYEGELKLAEEKAYKLPEPYKTNLRNEYPQDRLSNFYFVHVIRVKGSPDSAGGVAELSRYGNEWSANVRMKKAPSVERCIPESALNTNVKKLDDPETKKTVENIIQKRKDYVEKVETTINDLNKKHEQALSAQKETIYKYFKPNLRYDGTWKNDQTGKCSIIFGAYEADKTIITCKMFDPDVPNATIPATLTFDLKTIQKFPVRGVVNQKHPDFPKNTYSRYAGEPFATISHKRFLRHVNDIKMGINQSGELVGESSGYEFNFGKPR
jgi:hypothetical protein